MSNPELILGFRLDAGAVVLIAPNGDEVKLTEQSVLDELVRRITSDGQPKLVTRSVGATEEQLRAAYGVLYDAVRAQATSRVGEGVVDAAETVARNVHKRVERAFAGAPRGPSGRYKLLQERKAMGGSGS